MADRVKAEPAPASEVQFHYLKSQGFRVVHVDGIIGSFTPRGTLSMVAYSERLAIPQIAVHDVDRNGVLVPKPRQQIGRAGIVREMEIDMMLDLDTVEALHRWLGERLAEVKTLPLATKRKKGGRK